MTEWTAAANKDSLSSKDYVAELAIDHKCVSWTEDYQHYCSKFSVIACPSFVTGTIPSCPPSMFLKISNRSIDLASWRACLLALSTSGSNISEICLHNCQISSQHMVDLASSLEKLGRLDVLKIEYCTFGSIDSIITQQPPRRRVSRIPEGLVPVQIDAFSPLFSCSASIDYISLKGNQLSDEFLSQITQTLVSNITLRALNLSDNMITDVGATKLFQMLKVHHSLCNIALRNNELYGACLPIIGGLQSGIVTTPDDELSVKNIHKLISERNKSIKEANKKRKKTGFSELEEIPGYSESRLQKEKIDKNHSQLLITNRSLELVDVSFNPITIENVQEMVNILNSKPIIYASGKNDPEPVDLNLVFKNVFYLESDLDTLHSLQLPEMIHIISLE